MNNKEFKDKLITRALELSRRAIKLADKFPNKRSSWIITDQLLRSVMSIGANIIEAQAASSRKDFVNFLSYSLKSGNEAKYWLMLSKELDSDLVNEINLIYSEVDEMVKILGASVKKLKS